MSESGEIAVHNPSKPYEVVVALDFSELSERVFFTAMDLVRGRDAAELHVIAIGEHQNTLMRLPNRSELLTEETARTESRDHIAALVTRYGEQLGNVVVKRVAVYVVDGDPAKQIVALAQALDADLVVVGTHGRRGFDRLLLGSVAEAVVRTAPCAVHVVRPRDFLKGEPVPPIQPPLKAGEAPLKQFVHRRTYHYVHRNSTVPPRIMPAT